MQGVVDAQERLAIMLDAVYEMLNAQVMIRTGFAPGSCVAASTS